MSDKPPSRADALKAAIGAVRQSQTDAQEAAAKHYQPQPSEVAKPSKPTR